MFFLVLVGISCISSFLFPSLIIFQSHIQTNEGLSIVHAPRKCLKILAIGTSVTVGSPGFHAAHPDAPTIWKDPWPAVLEKILNNNFPCSSGSIHSSDSVHRVVNKADFGCSPQCHLQKWPENYADYSESEWDLIIVEPTTTGSTGNKMFNEIIDLQALLAALYTLSSSKEASFILLSASFRLKEKHPTTYEDIPEIERGVSDLARQWGIPFVSFPKYIFSNGLYNSSNHEAHCLEARCTYWVDRVHVTKTSHNIIAKLVLNIITNASLDDILGNDEKNYNASFTSITLPERPKNVTIDALSPAVKKLLPSAPKLWISFRTKELPRMDNNLICLKGFRSHNSRERLSTLYEYESTQSATNDTNNFREESQPHHNATIVLRMPMQCGAPLMQIEFLHSYTTNGVLALMSWTGEVSNDRGFSSCTEPVDSNRTWKFVGTFNSSNDEKVSVPKTIKFRVDKSESFVKGNFFGGNFHLLSIGIYCTGGDPSTNFYDKNDLPFSPKTIGAGSRQSLPKLKVSKGEGGADNQCKFCNINPHLGSGLVDQTTCGSMKAKAAREVNGTDACNILQKEERFCCPQCTFCNEKIIPNLDLIIPQTGGNTCSSIKLLAGKEYNGTDICEILRKQESVCCPEPQQ